MRADNPCVLNAIWLTQAQKKHLSVLFLKSV